MNKLIDNLDEPNKELIALAKDLLVKNIFMAAGIEGLPVTFPQTEKIFLGLSVHGEAIRQESIFFIIGLKRGWDFIFNALQFDEKLTFNIIKQIHKYNCELFLSDAGEIRRTPVSTSGTSYKPKEFLMPFDVEDKVNKLLHDESKEGIIRLMLYLMREQIFIDGNKRTAMMIANYLLIKNTHGILLVDREEIQEFLKLIVHYYDTEDELVIIEICSRWIITE